MVSIQRKMNYKQPPIQFFVEKLGPAGFGIAHLEGEEILLPRTLEGEVVLASLERRERGRWRGQVVEILEPSPHRRKAGCPWSGQCGGCDFEHVAPGMALKLKSQAELGLLAENFKRELGLVESPQGEAYRTRAVLHVGKKAAGGGQLGVGFYDHQRALVEPDECLLLDPGLNRCLPILRDFVKHLPPEQWAEIDGLEISLTLDISTQEVAVCPLISPSTPNRGRLSPSRLEELKVSLRAALGEVGVTEPAPPGPVVAMWPQWNLNLKAIAGSFTQVNTGINRLLVEKILAVASTITAQGGARQALDLYSGLGNIALPLFKSGFSVTAVENSPLAVKAARHNGRKLSGFNILAEDSAVAVRNLARKGAKFKVVILDPPRSGAQDLAPALASLAPELIIYVACYPAVLYRDLPAFISLGYGLESLTCLDMFPRTSHLESVAVLRQGV